MENEITLNQCFIPEPPKMFCFRGHNIEDEKCMVCGTFFEYDEEVGCVHDKNDYNKTIGHICMSCYEFISDEESE